MGFFNNIGIGTGGSGGTPTTYTYTNATAMPTKVGGWLAGSTFAGATLDQLWTGILYEYLNPSFTSFSISGQTSPLEVGDTILSGSKTFVWSTSNSSNVSPNTIIITDVTGGNIVLGTALANDGSEALAIGSNIQKVTQANHVFKIDGTNTNAVGFTRNYTINWQWRMWWGFLPQSSLVDADILTLQSSKLSTSFAGSITLPANPGTNYDYIVYPDSYGAISSIFDNTNSFNVTSDYTDQGVVSHTNQFGIAENHRVYRSVNPSAGKSGWNYTIS